MLFGLASFGFCVAYLSVNYFASEPLSTEESLPKEPKSNWD